MNMLKDKYETWVPVEEIKDHTVMNKEALRRELRGIAIDLETMIKLLELAKSEYSRITERLSIIFMNME